MRTLCPCTGPNRTPDRREWGARAVCCKWPEPEGCWVPCLQSRLLLSVVCSDRGQDALPAGSTDPRPQARGSQATSGLPVGIHSLRGTPLSSPGRQRRGKGCPPPVESGTQTRWPPSTPLAETRRQVARSERLQAGCCSQARARLRQRSSELCRTRSYGVTPTDGSGKHRTARKG